MKQRFSSRELFELRNSIPVDVLIRDTLNIPVKTSDDIFRFLCPICREFQTGVNGSTNLARCFRCEKNFNPIDMVMIVKGVGFIESVGYLKKLLATASTHCDDRKHALKQMLHQIGKPEFGRPLS